MVSAFLSCPRVNPNVRPPCANESPHSFNKGPLYRSLKHKVHYLRNFSWDIMNKLLDWEVERLNKEKQMAREILFRLANIPIEVAKKN